MIIIDKSFDDLLTEDDQEQLLLNIIANLHNGQPVQEDELVKIAEKFIDEYRSAAITIATLNLVIAGSLTVAIDNDELHFSKVK